MSFSPLANWKGKRMCHWFGRRVPLGVKAIVISVAGVLVSGMSLGACGTHLAGAVSCRQALENGIYDTQVKVYGTVSKLGYLGVDGFLLTSDGRELTVYYGSMYKDNGESLPDVSVDGIQNGDRVVVTGELKSAGKYTVQNSFWSYRIDKY